MAVLPAPTGPPTNTRAGSTASPDQPSTSWSTATSLGRFSTRPRAPSRPLVEEQDHGAGEVRVEQLGGGHEEHAPPEGDGRRCRGHGPCCHPAPPARRPSHRHRGATGSAARRRPPATMPDPCRSCPRPTSTRSSPTSGGAWRTAGGRGDYPAGPRGRPRRPLPPHRRPPRRPDLRQLHEALEVSTTPATWASHRIHLSTRPSPGRRRHPQGDGQGPRPPDPGRAPAGQGVRRGGRGHACGCSWPTRSTSRPQHAHVDLLGQLDALTTASPRSSALDPGRDRAVARAAGPGRGARAAERQRSIEPWWTNDAFEAAFRGSAERAARPLRRPGRRASSGCGPVLDIGCGRGEFLELLAERGVEACGRRARPRAGGARPRAGGLDVVHGDGIAVLARAARRRRSAGWR